MCKNATQFIPREKKRGCPEVHVAGVCVKRENNDISVLIAKRNSDRTLFPDLSVFAPRRMRLIPAFDVFLAMFTDSCYCIHIIIIANA